MSSVLPDLEYDVFISYRHNDNRSGWVTDFVNALQEELAATVKEPLSIYFDKNPHDGLLETHNVDKSLEGKLKCLIFVPIISQTYCDTKGFAWQYEFCAFNRLAKGDSFGRDIKLGNGNVTSRILPIKIHDIDHDDKVQIENEIGGVLRAIEFIYKEPGVNRPLKISDDRNTNQSKTDYRNQINKVANAIKDIVSAATHPQVTSSPTSNSRSAPTGNSGTTKRLVFAGLLLVAALAAVYFILVKTLLSRPHEVDKSIAVLPFENMSNDPEQEYFSDGITEEIINALTQLEGLKVTGRTSSFQFKGKEVDLKDVGEKLGVATVLEGSIRKESDQLRITVQLINAKDGYHLWSQRFDRKITDVFAIQDEIASTISSKLKLTLLEGVSSTPNHRNQQAYDLYLQGRFYFNKRGQGLAKAIELYKQAIALDSSFVEAYEEIAICNVVLAYYEYIPGFQGVEETRKWAQKALALDHNSSQAYTALGFSALHLERKWDDAGRFLERSIQLNPNNAFSQAIYGNYLLHIKNDAKAAEAQARKSIALDPFFFLPYTHLTYVLNREGRHEEAMVFAQKGLDVNDNSTLPYFSMFSTLLALNRNEEAIEMLQTGLAKSEKTPPLQAALCESFAIAGKKEDALKIYDDLIEMSKTVYVSPYAKARVSAAVNKLDDAFNYYNQALDEMNAGFTFWSTNSRSESRNQSFKKDPRYAEIMKRLEFPEQ